MGRSIRVFISSTWQDLQPECEAVQKALHRIQDTAFAGIEYFGSLPEISKKDSLSEVDSSDIYVGVFAHYYGSGITEAEYRRAREQDIPCLIYFKNDNVPVIPAHIERDPERIAKLATLKDELRQNQVVSSFRSPNHLASQVVIDMHNLLGTAPSVRREGPPLRGLDQTAIADSQGVVVGDQALVAQHLGTLTPSWLSRPDLLRLQHLADNIRQDLTLLKDYEDALRYEDDPRRRLRCRREIEQLRGSATKYQREYAELRVQVTDGPLKMVQNIASQLRQMDVKLDTLLTGQTATQDSLSGLRQAMLACFDASEQTIIAAVVEQLDQTQLGTVQAILDDLEAEQVTGSELQNTLTAVHHVLTEIQQRETILTELALADEVERLSHVVDAPKLDVKHKLKVAVPIIPLILSYEGEIELESRLDLEAMWQQLLVRIREG
jgi:hypothetical protein